MSPLSTLLLIIFYLIFFKRNNDKKYWILFLYVVMSFGSDILLVKFPTEPFYIFSFFTLIEYTIVCYFYYLSYYEKSYKWLLICCYPVFLVVLVYSFINPYKSNVDLDVLSSSLEDILIIIFSILFFYEQLKNPKINFIYDSKTFWIVVAFLIYMSATLFLFISTSFSSSIQQTISAWPINNIANIIKNLLLAVGFYKPLSLSIDYSSGNKSK